jgi:hypothetical protein
MSQTTANASQHTAMLTAAVTFTMLPGSQAVALKIRAPHCLTSAV